MNTNELQLKRAASSSLLSLLNLTFLPVLAFISLLFIYTKTESNTIDRYYVVLGIKTNLLAAVALLLMTGLMILLGGFDSPWTWVFVISYFVFVHAMFILFASWAMVRSWTGKKLKRQFLSK
jgi:carbon starvation protein CstA